MTPWNRMIASLLLCMIGGSGVAHELACPSDPARQAQLALLDGAQLRELQQEHGRHAVSTRTQRVFEHLLQAQRGEEPGSSHPGIHWYLAGYGAEAINAHAMQSGGIVMSRGLDAANVPEAAIAAALAHE